MATNKPSTDNNYTSLMIQAGVAMTLTAGVVFWAHSKTSALTGQIEALNKRIDHLEGVLKTQGEYIGKHDAVIQQIIAAIQSGRIPPPQKQRGPPPHSSFKGRGGIPQKRGGPPLKRGGNKGSPPTTSLINQEDEEEFTQSQQEELDTDLGDELGELYDPTQQECDGEYCEIPPSTDLKKKLKQKHSETYH